MNVQVIESEVDEQPSEELAQELLGTGDEADGSPAQGHDDSPGEAEVPESEDQEEAAAQQEEAELGEDGQPKPKEAEPAEAQESEVVTQAVERLSKVSGQELSDDKAKLEALSGVYLKSDQKIQSLSERLGVLAKERQEDKAWKEHPIIRYTMDLVRQGINPYAQVDQPGQLDGEKVSPAVLNLVNGLKQEIQTLKGQQQETSRGIQSNSEREHNAKVAEIRKTFTDFAKKPENADFKEILAEYHEMLKLDDQFPMPVILKKVCTMMEAGDVTMEEVWGILNPGKVVDRLKGVIAGKQKDKLKKGGMKIKGKGKAPRVKDLTKLDAMDGADFMNEVMSNIDAQAAGEE